MHSPDIRGKIPFKRRYTDSGIYSSSFDSDISRSEESGFDTVRPLSKTQANLNSVSNTDDLLFIKINNERKDVHDYGENAITLLYFAQQIPSCGATTEIGSWGGGVVNEPFPTDFNLNKIIGSGSFGTVHLIECTSATNTLNIVAKKITFAPSRFDDVKLEIEITLALQNHQYIVPCTGYILLKDTALLFLKYMEQGSLKDLLEKQTQGLQNSECLELFRQIVCGLEYLHYNRVIHRDLKPANILMETTMHIRLADFGTAKYISNNFLDNTPEVGTIAYMAPEAALSRKYTFAADIWSLGCTLLHMLTGLVPYSQNEINTFEILTSFMQNCKPPPEVNSDIVSTTTRAVLLNIFVKAQKRLNCGQILDNLFLKKNESEKNRKRGSAIWGPKAESSMFDDVDCSKNPGHLNFITFQRRLFIKSHLEKIYKTTSPQDGYDLCHFEHLLELVSGLTVKIQVNLTSPKRPINWPGTDISYPYSYMRDAREPRYGTGVISAIEIFEEEGDDFEKIKRKGKGKIVILTVSHLVFDDSEASEAICRCFYDFADSEDISLDSFTVECSDIERNVVTISCETHNVSLLHKLKEIKAQFEWQRRFVHKSHARKTTFENIVSVVSHPHGGPKKISLGKVIKKHVVDNKWSQYYYTAATCPGSSGALVFILGQSGGVWHYPHLHTGATDDPNINYSSVGFEVPSTFKHNDEIQVSTSEHKETQTIETAGQLEKRFASAETQTKNFVGGRLEKHQSKSTVVRKSQRTSKSRKKMPIDKTKTTPAKELSLSESKYSRFKLMPSAITSTPIETSNNATEGPSKVGKKRKFKAREINSKSKLIDENTVPTIAGAYVTVRKENKKNKDPLVLQEKHFNLQKWKP